MVRRISSGQWINWRTAQYYAWRFAFSIAETRDLDLRGRVNSLDKHGYRASDRIQIMVELEGDLLRSCQALMHLMQYYTY